MPTPVPPIITWTDVIAIAAELSSTPVPTQTAILAMVGVQVGAKNWMGLQKFGQQYLAAHLGTLSRKRGEGPTSEKSAGGLSESYQSLLQFGNLGLSAYGVEYERLLYMTPAALGMVAR